MLPESAVRGLYLLGRYPSEMARESKIEVTRMQLPHLVRDGVRAYKVVLDGTVVSKLRMGDSMELSCEPGPHRLWIRLDFKKSNTIDFTVHPDWTARFECEPGGRYLMALVDLFRSDKYIKIRQVGEVKRGAS